MSDNTMSTANLDLDIPALGAFAARTAAGDIPEEAQRFGRLLLLDSLGALLGGLRYPAVQALGGLVDAADGGGEAPFGWHLTLGSAATWLDADSGGSFHPAGGRIPPVPTAHPAPHVLPGLLHALLGKPVGDDEAVRVFILGCEIGLRFGVGTSLRPGLHPHGIHGPIAAAVAATLLEGGDAETLAAAVELGGSLPLSATLAVPMSGGTVRNAWTGLGAYYGSLAAGLARAGQRAEPRLLDGLYGGAITTDADPEEISGGLGERWRILDSYLKPYACARWIHPALDALRVALADAGSPAPGDISEIVVETFAFAASLDSTGDESDLHARFSLSRCAASLAVDGELDADGFLPGQFERPEVVELSRRVRLVEIPEFSEALPRERPARVTVVTAGGRSSAEVRQARGNPDSALTAEEIADKFLRNAGPSIPRAVLDPVVAGLTGAAPLAGNALSDLAAAVAGVLGGPR